MSRRGMVFMLSVAVASGLVAAGGIYQRLVGRGSSLARSPGSVPMVVARTTLTRGTLLSADHLEVVTLPRDTVPAGTVSDPRALFGRVVKEQIPYGSPVLEASLVPAARRSLVTASLAPGYRAVGVFIDSRGGVQQVLQAGDRVDVVVTMDDDEGVSSSKILLQDIEVLRVPDGSNSASRSEGIPVTLAVTPQDAERLSLAMHIGTMQLLVRSYADEQVASTSGVTRDTLLPEAEPSASYRVVEVIKGMDRTRQRFRE